HEARKTQEADERDELASFRRHLNRVIVEARDNVRAPADERLQRLRSALVVLQLDVEAFVSVEPEFLRERRRQVHHLIRSADGQAHVRAALRLRAGRREQRQTDCEFQPFHRSNQRSSRDTAMLTITTTTARTVMPAKTPVVSNVPSACEIT